MLATSPENNAESGPVQVAELPEPDHATLLAMGTAERLLRKAVARVTGRPEDSRITIAVAVALLASIQPITDIAEAGYGAVLIPFYQHWVKPVEKRETAKTPARPNGWSIEDE